MTALTILDETASGTVIRRLQIEIARETLTVGELIAGRVQAEVAAYNARQTGVFEGLIQPTDSERLLNGDAYRLRHAKTVNVEQQIHRALEAFRTNGFFVLVNDRQVETLEEEVWLGAGASVSFIKLTPLMGG